MTPEKQRIAIAEACGHIVTDHAKLSEEQWKEWYGHVATWVPDYLHDLNAMHEAVATLSDEQYNREDGGFTEQLVRVIGQNPDEGWTFRSMQEATAAQRAEAFLRATGRWEEDKS